MPGFTATLRKQCNLGDELLRISDSFDLAAIPEGHKMGMNPLFVFFFCLEKGVRL